MIFRNKNLRRIGLVVAFLCIGIANVCAQSMTDEQVLQFVVAEYQKGTSQAQIVTKLMQKGVDINQIRRVKKKYERQSGNGGFGVKDITGESASTDRLRKNNGPYHSIADAEADRHNLNYKRVVHIEQATELIGYKVIVPYLD